MKNLFIYSFLVLIFNFVAFSQTNEDSPCPTVSVTGPPGVAQPNEPIVFTAFISKDGEKYDLKYFWSVSNGKIIEGQEAYAVKVLQEDVFGKNLTVTVKITGLPKNCKNTASETTAIDDPPIFRQFDEFSISAPQIDKARLDYLINELQNNPNAVAYIIEKFGRENSRNTRELKIRKLTDYLFKVKKIKKDRIVIWDANSNETLTQFFIVPAGANPPKCDNCFI